MSRPVASLPITAVAILLFGVAGLPFGADEPPKQGGENAAERGGMEVRFADKSTLKLKLRDERIEITTPYGKLLVPVADVHRIEFASRIPEEVIKQIDSAIKKLADDEFRVREAATAELLKQRERAYPALLAAAKNKDPEVARRVGEMLDKLRRTIPEEDLVFRKFDVLHTEHSKISGRIERPVLKATSTQFGEVELKLADIRSLRSLAIAGEVDTSRAGPDPGNLTQHQHQIGKTFLFRVTGRADGALWGTDTYTSDSTLGAAAVHAGVLQLGQTGVVKVTIVQPLAFFQGSVRNGIGSAHFGQYPGAYTVSRP